MLLGIYLYTLLFLGLFFWLSVFIFISYFNPYKADVPTLTIFFASVFLALAATLTLIGFYLRIRFLKKEALFNYFKSSLRQAILFGILAVGILLFLAFNLFNWWTGGLYLAVIILLELILRNK